MGFSARSAAKARGTGLATRPLEQTLADTLAWEAGRDLGGTRRAGLSDDDERLLIEELAHAQRPDRKAPPGPARHAR